ncbi:MAG: hypothetical protein EPO57_00285 [Chitinophagaceae bacterium]|nr:MAG: hypothetical protein EPO57_00285 [Chitinophagaceae bacterium]
MFQFKTYSLFTLLLGILLVSCSVIPKNYPLHQPFVYQTSIQLEGKFSKDEKKNFISQLHAQLDDSIKLNTVRTFIYKGFNRSILVNPPVYENANAEKSASFMKDLLNAEGYLYNSIRFDTMMIYKKMSNHIQNRTIVKFYVAPDNQFKLNSVRYNILHPALQELTNNTLENSELKKGNPFSKQIISQELDRLVDVYRSNGYLKFTRDELVAVWDTLDISFLQPAVDPFEQIAILEKINQKRNQPTTQIEIQLRPRYDSSLLQKYYVGNTTIYPDLNPTSSSTKEKTDNLANNITIKSYQNIFKPKFLAQNIYFKSGDLYNQQLYLKTINQFNMLGAWKQVTIEPLPRTESDTVDFTIRLTPAEKYSLTANVEGSRNTNANLIFDETLLGVGMNVQLLHRNFLHSSNQSVTNIRYSTEVESKGEFVKSKQTSISHTIYFPKSIPNLNWIPKKFSDNFRTVLSVSLANIERKDFFNHTSFHAAWGYNFSWNNKSVSIKLPNIEYALLKPQSGLISIFNQTPTFRYIFNEGLVLSAQLGYQVRGGSPKSSYVFRANIEESGLLTNSIKVKILDSLFRFVKLDVEFIKNIVSRKNEFVFRTYLGAGFSFETRNRNENANLPFFKQFYAGGPNSMRAWGVRLLGPGSTLKSRDEAPFRFGDFQFETNAEFRFPVTKIFDFPVSSCFFVDIGNVWFLKKNNDFLNGHLSVNNFMKDLAVGAGTGLRIDFSYFRLRLDYAYKIKNPSPEPFNVSSQNQWFYKLNPFGGVMQLGINYPFSF